MRFDSYHPLIELIWFVIVIVCTVMFDHPVFMAIAYASAFVYSVKLLGKRAFFGNLLLLPLMVAFTVFYACFHHFGVTVLYSNYIDNEITLEALVYGAAISMRAAAVIMEFKCFHFVFCTDKVVYLFGRVSPRLSMALAMLLRLVPRIGERSGRIKTARSGIGYGPKNGSLFFRIRNTGAVISSTVTQTIDALVTLSDSMRSRGVTLRGRKAFSIYRFDHRDRSVVIVIFLFATVILTGTILSQTKIYYDPRIIMNRITPLSFVFYAAYAAECCLPLALQLMGEAAYAGARRASAFLTETWANRTVEL